MKDHITMTLQKSIPKVIHRTWEMDYLYKYSFGNKLPRGKKFDKVRAVEKLHLYRKIPAEYNWDIERLNYKSRISPFLVKQRTLLVLAHAYGLCNLNTDSILGVIAKLEGSTAPESIDLIKHNCPFNKKGLFKAYKHHHVPMLPSSLLSMYAKDLNQQAILDSVDTNTATVSLSTVDEYIKARGAKKGGRLTGHWLITKEINNETYYLGIFPHGNGNRDDSWIKKQLITSEKLLKKQLKNKKG